MADIKYTEHVKETTKFSTAAKSSILLIQDINIQACIDFNNYDSERTDCNLIYHITGYFCANFIYEKCKR